MGEGASVRFHHNAELTGYGAGINGGLRPRHSGCRLGRLAASGGNAYALFGRHTLAILNLY